jgi:prepilin signal peptidase PulO-like enzyme (type II secretory pathway)
LVGYAALTDRTINGFCFGQAAPLAIAAVISAVVIAVLLWGLIALLAEIKRHLHEMKEGNIRRLKQLRDKDSKAEPSV